MCVNDHKRNKNVNKIVIIIIVLLMIVLQCNNAIIVSPYW